MLLFSVCDIKDMIPKYKQVSANPKKSAYSYLKCFNKNLDNYKWKGTIPRVKKLSHKKE